MAWGCPIKNVLADCKNKGFEKIPENLPEYIEILDLRNNKISTITNKSFIKFPNLQELKLGTNMLDVSKIESGCLYSINKLRVLDFSDNDMELELILSSKLFHYSRHIEALDLRRNRKFPENYNVPFFYNSNALSAMRNLSKLYIDLAPVPKFSSDFKMFPSLQILVFDSCYLCNMSNTTFENITSSIQELHMMQCDRIKVVEFGFLSHFLGLKVINLAGSHVHLSRALYLLSPLAHSNMSVINFHRVSHIENDNDILPYALVVTANMMKYLQTICVKTLNLADNGIVNFKKNSLLSYDHPECFENFVISSNRFSVHFKDKAIEIVTLVSRMDNVKLFDFSYVPLHLIGIQYLRIPNGAISSDLEEKPCLSSMPVNITIPLPPKLETVRFSHFLQDSCPFNIVILNGTSVRHIDISYCPLKRFPDIYFIGTDSNNVRSIDFSGIDSSWYASQQSIPLFSKIHNASFRDANFHKSLNRSKHLMKLIPSVQTLDISSNYLDFLYVDSFKTNNNLTYLDLSSNLFTEIPLAVTSIQNLTFLNMSENNLLSVNKTIRDWLDFRSSMAKITLGMAGNVFACSCENREFIRWFFMTKVNFDQNKNYSCLLNNGSKITTVEAYVNYHSLFGDCENETWLIVGIVLLSTIIAIIIPVSIIFNFRWQIAYFIYRKLRKAVEKTLNLKFEYDAYVSYADDGEEWVRDVLVQTIENKWGLKLCIEERDFLAGHSQADNIAESIHVCRQIIFVMTPQLMEREWTSFEIERAKYEKVYSNLFVTVINRGVGVEEVSSAFSSIWHDVCIVEMLEEDKSIVSLEKLKIRLLLNR